MAALQGLQGLRPISSCRHTCSGCLGSIATEGLRHIPCTPSPTNGLSQALPLALAAARDAKGNAFKDAVELLLDVLEHVDNSGNLYDPDNFLAAALEALGRMHTDDAEVRGPYSAFGRALIRGGDCGTDQHTCAIVCTSISNLRLYKSNLFRLD